MKNLSLLTIGLLAMAGLSFTSCSDDDDDDQPANTSGNIVISQNITSNTTWNSSRSYELDGRIVVESGATLTIAPGTVIKGQAGREAAASALIIARGAKIDAVGTASEPIIFTSVTDEIEPGMIVSPNLDASFKGLWGGLIVLGNAPISADGATEVQIEGIPPSDPNGLYGGSDATDNSGRLAYISIRHGGTLLGEGNEINGLTLGGVGSGTEISNVEVVANLDDGIECFGGSVNITNALVWAQGDDAYDIDQAYTGTIDNFIFKGDADSDHALEIDGPEGSLNGGATMTNGTCIGYNEGYNDGEWEGNFGEYADFRDGAQGAYNNILFYNFSENSDFELDDEASSNNYGNGTLSFANHEVVVSHLQAGNLTTDDIFQDKFTGNSIAPLDFAAILNGGVGSATVGANASVFANWTMGSATGEL